MTDHSYILTESRVPAAYYDGYAEATIVGSLGTLPVDQVLLRTIRTGADGVSDAQYLADRIASGLYFAKVAPSCFSPKEA